MTDKPVEYGGLFKNYDPDALHEECMDHKEWRESGKPDRWGIVWPRDKPVCNENTERDECAEVRWTLAWLSASWPYGEWSVGQRSCHSDFRHWYKGEVNGCTIQVEPGNIEVTDAFHHSHHISENDYESAAEDGKSIAKAVALCFEVGPVHARYIASDRWREKRNVILKRDGFKCVRCAATRNLQVHHLTYARLSREHPNDLVTLCAKCHAEVDPPKNPRA